MSAEFTPGPWFTGRLVLADDDDDFGTISIGQQDLSDRPHKDAHYEDTIAEVWQNPNLAEDAEANARLIAAAPALYEAARKHLEWIEKEHDGPQYGKLSRDTHPLGEAIWRQWWNEQLELCAETEAMCRDALASCDTQPKAGDVKQAPLVSGAVTNEVRQTPTTSPSSPSIELDR